MKGYIYVVTNPSMPGLVKIGKSVRKEPKDRILELFKSGVPVPFEIQHVSSVEKVDEVEKALHEAFFPDRVNPRREFFRIEPEQVIALLKILEIADCTLEVSSLEDNEIDKESKASAILMRQRRPNMDFLAMGIPSGSELLFTKGGYSVTTVGSNRVLFGGEEVSLTSVTRSLLNKEYDPPPAFYWTFEGTLLRDLYERTIEDRNGVKS